MAWQQFDTYLVAWASLGGPLQTINRSELVAAIIILLADRAAFLGLDSQYVINGMRAAERGRDKPYELMHNGDLWKLADKS